MRTRQAYYIRYGCWNTSQVFKAGHRIGLEISSSAFPKYDRNLYTGAPLGQSAEVAVAEQWVYPDGKHLSAIILPLITAASTSDLEYEVFAYE